MFLFLALCATRWAPRSCGKRPSSLPPRKTATRCAFFPRFITDTKTHPKHTKTHTYTHSVTFERWFASLCTGVAQRAGRASGKRCSRRRTRGKRNVHCVLRDESAVRRRGEAAVGRGRGRAGAARRLGAKRAGAGEKKSGVETTLQFELDGCKAFAWMVHSHKCAASLLVV